MTPESYLKLKSQLMRHEGLRLKPYTDTKGNITIGYGRCLSTRDISNDEAMYFLNNDIPFFTEQLQKNFKFYEKLTDARKAVLINMCFNLGLKGLMGFKQFLLAIECGDYIRAAKEMVDSAWAEQVGNRAVELSNMMKKGDF